MILRRLAVLGSVFVVVTACAAPIVPAASPSPSTPTGTASTSAPSAGATATVPSQPPQAGIVEVKADVPRTVPGDGALDAAAPVVAGDRQFALRLYEAMRTERGNVFISPYSISTALSMVYAGARGATARELATALGATTPEAWHAGRNAIDTALADVPMIDPAEDVVPLTIEPTNALFGQAGYPWKTDYLDILARSYGAGVKALDFARAPAACRDVINRWVNDRTHDRIPELLPIDFVHPTTRFVLVNAIYFRATWATPFDKARTKKEAFHRADGSTVTVPLMHGDLRGGYAKGNGWQAVSIPYVNAEMVVILPDAGKFAAIEHGFDPAFLKTVEQKLTWADLKLTLPKWKSNSHFDLIPVLRKAGINNLFDAGDLSGMAAEPLAVTAAVHQANVTVDEAGTEAAAATAIGGDTTGGGPDISPTVRVDRPFIYLIRSSRTGEILFVGRVMDPTAG